MSWLALTGEPEAAPYDAPSVAGAVGIGLLEPFSSTDARSDGILCTEEEEGTGSSMLTLDGDG